jgi:hypothetical protein
VVDRVDELRLSILVNELVIPGMHPPEEKCQGGEPRLVSHLGRVLERLALRATHHELCAVADPGGDVLHLRLSVY